MSAPSRDHHFTLQPLFRGLALGTFQALPVFKAGVLRGLPSSGPSIVERHAAGRRRRALGGLLVELPGTAPGSKQVSPRINENKTTYNLLDGNVNAFVLCQACFDHCVPEK